MTDSAHFGKKKLTFAHNDQYPTLKIQYGLEFTPAIYNQTMIFHSSNNPMFFTSQSSHW